MPSVETIYQESVMPLPRRDQIKLAEIIMEHAVDEPRPRTPRISALKLLEGLPVGISTRSASEIDEYLRMERDSWND